MTTNPEKAAKVPPGAAAIVDLLNSRTHAIHSDRLDDPERATQLVRRFDADAELTPAVVEAVRALRHELVTIVGSGDEAVVASAWDDFTARTSSVTLQHDFSSPGSVRLRQVAGDPVVGGIARDVAELVSNGSWSRVRICANESCGGAFYDLTRSRTQRWDSYETCGNHINVAAHRARKAGSE